MNPDTQEQCVRTRDPPAPQFRTVFEDHFDYVWKSLRNLGVEHSDLEDVVHDVFVAVHRHLDQYDPRRPLRPWLFSFAAGVAANYRRLARHRREVVASNMSESDCVMDVAMDVHEQSAARDARDMVESALAAIVLDRRAVLVMHDLDGYSVPDIAEALSIPLNTAYSRLRVARKEFCCALQRLRSQRGTI